MYITLTLSMFDVNWRNLRGNTESCSRISILLCNCKLFKFGGAIRILKIQVKRHVTDCDGSQKRNPWLVELVAWFEWCTSVRVFRVPRKLLGPEKSFKI